ncbi:MAG: hypothetical protein K2I81_04530 [Alphaproteobacteria bacterium]|nr:hypothetical protein [Alphaproteobacteria bacterium]
MRHLQRVVKNLKCCFRHIGCATAWVAICCIFITGGSVASRAFFSNRYADSYVIIETDFNTITDDEHAAIQHLIQRNKIIPVSLVYEDTLRYYDIIITILIALLGFFAVVSWFVLGGRMRDSLHKELQANWFDICVEDKLSKFLKNNVSDYLAEELDEEKIRSIAREEYETMRNKLSDEIQEANQAVLNVVPAAKRVVRKNKGGK